MIKSNTRRLMNKSKKISIQILGHCGRENTHFHFDSSTSLVNMPKVGRGRKQKEPTRNAMKRFLLIRMLANLLMLFMMRVETSTHLSRK